MQEYTMYPTLLGLDLRCSWNKDYTLWKDFWPNLSFRQDNGTAQISTDDPLHHFTIIFRQRVVLGSEISGHG
jgi:hypothetical protein